MNVKRHWIAALGLMALSTASWADQARDLVVGNGTPGPYPLSWKATTVGTESVQVNAVLQTRNLDYTLDASAGTITFTHPLPAQSAAEVDYQYDPAHAVRSGANLALPLSFDLAHGDHGSLSLDATYKHSGDAATNDPGALTVGLGGGWQGAREQLTTHLLFAPQLASNQPNQGTNSLDRAGLALSGSTQMSPMAKFSFGYVRAGTYLGQAAADNGWQAGTQTVTLGSNFTPSQKVSAFVNYSQADPLAGGLGMTSQVATGLTASPLKNLQLQTHWTQATAAGGATDTGDLSLTAKPTASTQVNASLSLNNAPGVVSDTQAINLAAQVAPSRTLTVNAGAGQTRLGDVATNRQQIALNLTPRTQVQLHTGVILTQTDQYAATAANIGGAFQPASFLLFSADYTSRNAPVDDPTLQDSLDGSAAQVALIPVKGVRLTGHYQQNPNDAVGNAQHLAQRGLGLETSVGAVSLTGGYDWSRQYDTATVGTTLNLGLGLRLSRALQLTGGYQQTLTGLGDTSTGFSQYSFGLTHNLGDRFNLSMTGTMQQTTGTTVSATPNYTASANLGMKF